MGFSRQGYWSGLPYPPAGELSNPETEPVSLMFPSLTGGFFNTSATSETESKRNTWNVQNTPDKTLRNQRRKGTHRGSSGEDAKPCVPRKWGKFMCWTQILPFPPMFVEGKKHISPIFLDSFLRSPPYKNMRGEQGSTGMVVMQTELVFFSTDKFLEIQPPFSSWSRERTPLPTKGVFPHRCKCLL